MSKEDAIVVEGIVTDCLPGIHFKVLLDTTQEIRAYISGKMSKNHIKILLGDKVKVELTPYDLTLGRIVYRFK